MKEDVSTQDSLPYLYVLDNKTAVFKETIYSTVVKKNASSPHFHNNKICEKFWSTD